MGYTREDIERIVKEEGVSFIRLQFTDIFGAFKNVAITAGQLQKALNNGDIIVLDDTLSAAGQAADAAAVGTALAGKLSGSTVNSSGISLAAGFEAWPSLTRPR